MSAYVSEWVNVCLCVCLNFCTCLCVVMCMSVRSYMSVSSSQTSFILLFICSQDESFIRESKTWVACPELCVKESQHSVTDLCDTGDIVTLGTRRVTWLREETTSGTGYCWLVQWGMWVKQQTHLVGCARQIQLYFPHRYCYLFAHRRNTVVSNPTLKPNTKQNLNSLF